MNHNSEYLRLLNIPVWQPRGQEYEDNDVTEIIEDLYHQPEIANVMKAIEMPAPLSQMTIAPAVSMENIHVPQCVSIDACTACSLHSGRTQVITGKGTDSASLLVITEAPTFNEDVAGEPFAEEAGRLFENILRSIGYSMDDVYITPYVKCSPYQSFITQTEEEACFQHLSEELQRIQPQKVLLLGRNVAKYLLKSSQSFDTLRSQVHYLQQLGNIPVHVSYNPYQLLKFPEEKRKVWNDIKRLAGKI